MIVVTEMEQLAYSEKKVEKSPWVADDRPSAPKVLNVPKHKTCKTTREDF